MKPWRPVIADVLHDADVLKSADVPETARDMALQIGDSDIAQKAKKGRGTRGSGL